MCQTERTSALSTPMPKALVATITSTSPPMKRAWVLAALLGLHAGVVGKRRAARLRAASPPPRRCRGGCRSRRSRVGSPGRPARPRAAPSAAPSSRCPPAGPRRRRCWVGRSRSGPGAGRASRSAPRSRAPPASVAVAVQAITVGRPSRVGDLGQAQVVGPEVVTPLGDAVGLVDREQVDPPLFDRAEEDGRAEALRRAVDDPCLAAAHLGERAAHRVVAHRRRHHRHRMPARRSAAATGRSSARSAD